MKAITKFYKSIFTIVMASILLSSCNMARFDSIPGARLNNTPEKLIGNWGGRIVSPKGGVDSFTVEFSPNNINFRTSYGMKDLKFEKDYVIHSFGNYMVIAFNDPNFRSLKNLIFLEEAKNAWKVYPILEANFKFDSRVDFEEIFDTKYFTATPEGIDILPKNSQIEFDNATSEKQRIHYYLADDTKFETLLSNRMKNRNFILMSKPQSAKSVINKPKTTIK